MKAHSTNTNTDTNTDLPILKILRFVNFGRKLLRPKPLESVPVKVKVKVFLRIILARKLASSPTSLSQTGLPGLPFGLRCGRHRH